MWGSKWFRPSHFVLWLMEPILLCRSERFRPSHFVTWLMEPILLCRSERFRPSHFVTWLMESILLYRSERLRVVLKRFPTDNASLSVTRVITAVLTSMVFWKFTRYIIVDARKRLFFVLSVYVKMFYIFHLYVVQFRNGSLPHKVAVECVAVFLARLQCGMVCRVAVLFTMVQYGMPCGSLPHNVAVGCYVILQSSYR